MDQGLTGCPREECADDVHVDDIRKGVALLREPVDIILQGLVGLLLVALEVLGIPRMDICPLEISDEGPLEIRPVADTVRWEEFEPCPNMFPHADGEILNDEKVIIHPLRLDRRARNLQAKYRGSFPRCTWLHLWVVGSAVGTALSGYVDQRPVVPGPQGWDSRRLANDHAWGAFHRSPRWFGQDPCHLPPLPLGGRHHHAGPNAGC